MTNTRAPRSLATLMLAIAGCGGAGTEPPRLLPSPAPLQAPPPAQAAQPASPAPLAQQFADATPEPAFQDPDRRKKLASAFARIDEIAQEELSRQGMPSLAIGVVIDGELVHSKGFGIANAETKAAPDADTVYDIGSITKSFTAMAVLSLRDEGALSLDDPLSKWVPEAGKLVYPTRDAPPITLRQLLTHTSGLPREASHLPMNEGLSEEALTKLLVGLSAEHPAGTEHVYSNLGYALLGISAGHAAHAPYREIMQKRVLGPLGMNSSVWDPKTIPPARLATPHIKGQNGKLTPVDAPTLGAEEPAGGLYSSVRDMSHYVAFQLSAYPPRNTPEAGPLKRSSAREAHFNALLSGRTLVRLSSAPREGESLVEMNSYRYGYGWVVEQTCDFDEIVWHNGSIPGYHSGVAFLPAQGVGIIALTNLNAASPEIFVNRALRALQQSGGLSKRALPLSPAFEPAMRRFLDVYNNYSESGYKAMLPPGRGDAPALTEEKAELEGYKKLRGACKSFAPLDVLSQQHAIFKLDCEKGPLEMNVTLAPSGLITGFTGTSRNVPVPSELRKVADPVVGLIKKWDEGVYKKLLGKTTKSHDETRNHFEALRAVHGACVVKSMTNVVFDKKLVLQCEHGGNLTLALTIDPKSQDTLTGYNIDSLSSDACPAR